MPFSTAGPVLEEEYTSQCSVVPISQLFSVPGSLLSHLISTQPPTTEVKAKHCPVFETKQKEGQQTQNSLKQTLLSLLSNHSGWFACIAMGE